MTEHTDLVERARSELDHPAASLCVQLYGDEPGEDLASHDAASLAGAARMAADALRRFSSEGSAVVTVDALDAPGGRLAIATIANGNRPFIVDSVLAAVVAHRLDIRLVTHPIVGSDGASAARGAAGAVSLVQVHVADPGDEGRAALANELRHVLRRVNDATDGWAAMLERLDREIATFRDRSRANDAEETVRFLEWLRDGNFIFLGMRDYRFEEGEGGELARDGATGLGILSDPELRVLRRAPDGSRDEAAPHIHAFLTGDDSLVVTKANTHSVVHRRTHLDYVGLKRLGEDGQSVGELRIVGLFTSSAYSQSVLTIPYLDAKARATIERLSPDPSSHSGKALLNVLETYPRDELFQIDVHTLARFSTEIVRAGERPRVRVLPRIDRFHRFVSVIVLVPKERYNSRVRERVGDLLAERYEGHVSAYYPNFPEGPLARVHIIIGRDGNRTPEPDVARIEDEVESISADWDALFQKAMPGAGIDFSAAYKEAVPIERAADDARRFAALEADGLDVQFDAGGDGEEVRLRLIRRGGPVPLSRRVPVLENMGFVVESERTYEGRSGGDALTLHDMAMRPREPVGDLDDRLERMREVFGDVWGERADDDGFNALVLYSNVAPAGIRVLRAYARYLRQTNITFSQELIATTLVAHPQIADRLERSFVARHAGTGDRDAESPEAADSEIDELLADVPSLNEDQILRRMRNAIQATLRTNAFMGRAPGGAGPLPGHLVFKLDPKALDGLPEPRPFRELFVYGPEVEGVHLRFGPVARGGLRWSDRAEDYRTEVLGLVKAQQVKNAVIVPVGAKGGFYPRALPPRTDRQAWFEAGRDAYKTFIRSMLSVTDNIEDGEVVPAPVTRLDGDDPYFVVAADKGTATFSDTANAIAREEGFWLDDAFASGGSAGYDHKAMGITARGAWVAVQRHFREMGRDIQTEPFTVAGVGDMSGDVFGNGMLLSPVIRLVAAFDHRDIFIDPDPDPAKGFAERKRLFETPGVTWQDYDHAALSEGGGVHSRSQKTIALSPQALAALDLPDGSHPPQVVLNAILKARVDLMWFGGIGTYIKARHETHAEVGDRANDAIRIDGHECRSLAIGEGANLGATQDGRVEYALEGGPEGCGGAVNSDAVDNSAGVNSSDVEVNIKIALADAMRAGRLTRENRDALLVRMTDSVADLVLDNNVEQTLGISVEQRKGAEGAPLQERLMQSLERRGLLDRAVENLPDTATLDERLADGRPLTRSEIGTLVSYAKLTAFDEIVASDVPDDPALEADLTAYFPEAMRGDFADEIARHRLRREIIGTRLVNRVVNRGGPTIFVTIFDRTGAPVPLVASSFEAAHRAFEADELFAAIAALDTKVHGRDQNRAYAQLTDALRTATLWRVRNAAGEGIGPSVERMTPAVASTRGAVTANLPPFLSQQLDARRDAHAEAGFPGELADKLAHVPLLPLALDVLLVAEGAGVGIERAAAAFFDLTETFRIGRIETAADALQVTDYYDGLALARGRDAIAAARIAMATAALKAADDTERPVHAWLGRDSERIERARLQIADMVEGGPLSVSRLTVAANLLGDLAG